MSSALQLLTHYMHGGALEVGINTASQLPCITHNQGPKLNDCELSAHLSVCFAQTFPCIKQRLLAERK
jgi:hypothetical protein